MDKMKKKKYRYIERRNETEKDYNIHVREMISVLKHEKVRKMHYTKNLKLSNHAYARFKHRINSDMSLVEATRFVKSELDDALRIGTILSYDGRVGVLYAKNKIGYHLSPDLKTVVTIAVYNDLIYEPVVAMLDENPSKEEMIEIHMKRIKEIEAQEEIKCKNLLILESNVSDAQRIIDLMIKHTKRYSQKKGYKSAMSEQSYKLKTEGRKLFKLSAEKRHIMRSLVSLL